VNIRTIYLPNRLAELNLSEDTRHPLIATIHKQLAERGLYRAAIHDLYNAATREAIARFQETEGLPATGTLTPVTYCRLQPAAVTEIAPSRSTKKADFSLPRANIMLTKSQRQLTLFDGNTPLRHYPVAIGKSNTPTPVGNFSIILKITNPGGILGTRWLGLSIDSYGIHGTSKPWLIGQMVSNGCIRMHNANAEELYALVRLGTPVYIRD
jgi:lipoprotein-anchoring transpeptidase ErfK/SrfK